MTYKELTPDQAKRFARELRYHQAKVGRTATQGEFRAIRAEYERLDNEVAHRKAVAREFGKMSRLSGGGY